MGKNSNKNYHVFTKDQGVFSPCVEPQNTVCLTLRCKERVEDHMHVIHERAMEDTPNRTRSEYIKSRREGNNVQVHLRGRQGSCNEGNRMLHCPSSPDEQGTMAQKKSHKKWF